MNAWLGVDCGSITLKFALIDESKEVLSTLYMRSKGVIQTLQRGLKQFKEMIPSNVEITNVGATGSARKLLGVLVGADVVKTEILAHAIGCMEYVPEVRTIFEIGGEDSKLIILEDGIMTNFAMNNVCSGGTGAFLDEMANRAGIRIEGLGEIALRSKKDVSIPGRCSVFARTDAIHKLNTGYALEDVLMGMCRALIRNYLAMLAGHGNLKPPYSFQGGTSQNIALKKALEERIDHEVIVPPHAECLGAIGMAILSKRNWENNGHRTAFRGFELSDLNYSTKSFTCGGCDNRCEVIQALQEDKVIGSWGSRCGKWDSN